jgi:stearoyl-CoA desaturase (delta-9 desaturase)
MTQTARTTARLRLDWVNTLFLGFSHLMAVTAIVYLAAVKASPWTLGLALVWFMCCAVSITGGYHRLFAHKTYRAIAPLRAFYLLFGAASVQNSALKWSSDHRRHHAFTDDEADPYNITRGFWWAHVGWVLFKNPKEQLAGVNDLKRDRLILLQDRFYLPLALGFGTGGPALIGLLWGDPIGCLLVAGFLRLVIQWHATFAVNSVAHCIGSRPFCTRTSARNSFLTAFITLGEGYHNFHHRFQTDYRNGVRWFHFDPTKWFVWCLSKVGGTWDLQRTPAHRIARARAEVTEQQQAG